MVSKKSRTEVRVKKHNRMRNHLAGTAQRPRLAVFRSNNHMYAQIIDDTVEIHSFLHQHLTRISRQSSRRLIT